MPASKNYLFLAYRSLEVSDFTMIRLQGFMRERQRRRWIPNLVIKIQI